MATITEQPAAGSGRKHEPGSGPGGQEDRGSRPAAESRLMKWAPVVVIASAPTIMLANTLRPVSDPDTFWHLRAGEYLWDQWQFTGPAPGPRFATRPWTLHEWAPELLMAGAAHLGGLPGVALLHALTASALLITLYFSCRLHAGPLPSALAATMAWVGASSSISPRPQMVSFILLAVVTSVWLRTAKDGRPRWWLIPLTWVWACCHGLWIAGVIVGVAVVVAMALDRRVGVRPALRLMLVPVLSVIAAAATPVGPRLLLAPLEVRGYAKYVTEWAPASLAEPAFLATTALSVVVVLGWARGQKSVTWTHIAVWAVALVWTLTYSRTVALGAVMLAPLASLTLQRLTPTVARLPRAGRERLVVLAGFVVAGALAASMASGLPAGPGRMPTGLDRPVAALPAETIVFNEYSLGGWLLWSHRNVEPVIDGRTEIYPLPYVDDYQSALGANEGWQETVRATGATAALLPKGGPLAEALEAQLSWDVVAEADGYVLLGRP